MRYFILMLFVAVSVWPSLLMADVGPSHVQRAESYLETLRTAQAKFVQIGADGSRLSGTFYLNRPGKLRFEYDDPVEDFIVADGFFLYYYDAELGQQSNAPIGQTLADFLLRPGLKLSGDVTVTSIKDGDGFLEITLVQTAEPEAGSLTLGFAEEPFHLLQWRVADPAGFETTVRLYSLETDVHFPGGLFVYSDPKKSWADRYN